MTTLGGPIVVKRGGAASLDLARFCQDIAALRAAGERVVVVHGGADDIAVLADQLGVPARTLRAPDGRLSRYTDPEMLDALVLAMTGRVKPRIVAALAAVGVAAVGLTGLDGALLRAIRKPARRAVMDDRIVVVRDDQSGRISGVDPTVLHAVLAAGLTPVVSPPAAGPAGTMLNVDADRVAAAIATALQSDRLVFLTAAAGVLGDPDDGASTLDRCALDPDGPIPAAYRDGMHRKLIAAREALLAGVCQVIVADGRVATPVAVALRGGGTTITLTRSPR